jgi:SAM-dependent methyltransferase
VSAVSKFDVADDAVRPEVGPNSSLRAVVEASGYRPYGDWCWDGYKPTIVALAKAYGLKRLLEIGGGRDPSFSPEEAAEHGFQVTINDISSVELENMKANFGTACFDVSGDISSTGIAKGAYDLGYSRMVFEHVKDVEQAWKNLYQLLAPGGVAIAFYPTLYCPPFVVNKLIPESVSSAIVNLLYKHRTAEEDPKFPAFYDHCYGAPGLVEPMLRDIGYSDVAIMPFYGHEYFVNIPVVREIDAMVSNLARRTNFGRLSAYAYAVVRK